MPSSGKAICTLVPTVATHYIQLYLALLLTFLSASVRVIVFVSIFLEVLIGWAMLIFYRLSTLANAQADHETTVQCTFTVIVQYMCTHNTNSAHNKVRNMIERGSECTEPLACNGAWPYTALHLNF